MTSRQVDFPRAGSGCPRRQRRAPLRAHLLPLLMLLLLAAAPASGTASAERLADCRQRLSTAPDTPVPVLSLPLRVGIWNVKKFQRPGSGQMLERLARRSELLLLQESLADADAGEHWRLFAPGFSRGPLRSGVEIRAPVAADLQCRLRFREPWLRTPKAAAVARFNLRGMPPLLVINLHAVNFTLGSGDYRRQLKALGTLLTAHRGPALIGGDFNHWNAWRQRALQAFVTAHGLEPLALSPDWRSRHLGRAVDALLLRGLRAVAGSALPTRSSDHHPIIATLLPPQRRAPAAAADSDAAASVPAPGR